VISQFISYKIIDIAIRVFYELKKKLIIIGEGSKYKKLRKMANPNIKFMGLQEPEHLKRY